MEKNLKIIVKAVNDYVSFVAKSEKTAMEKFYNVGSLLVTEFPETSARDIAEKLGNIASFGKSQVALAMKLARDFHKAPNMSIREYRIHSGNLAKIDVDKRLDVANSLHGKGQKEIKEIYKNFGLKYGKDKVIEETPENPLDARVDRRRLEDFAKLCLRDNMQIVACEVFVAIFGYDVVLTAVESAKNAIKEKQNATRKLRKKAA